jgi:tetratricopeptide (TPR) repeat protein
MGKTRLIQELIEDLPDGALILASRCLDYGTGITFWPLARMISQAAGLEGDEPDWLALERLRSSMSGAKDWRSIVDGLAPMIGVGGATANGHESIWAVRSFLEALAAHQPVVVIFDDLQWAQPKLVDLICDVATAARDVPLFIVCAIRDEFFGASARLADVGDVIPLRRLPNAAQLELVESLLPKVGIPTDLLSSAIATASGSPLTIEQQLQLWIDSGVIQRAGQKWKYEGSGAETVGSSLDALVDGRIASLPPDVARLLKDGSIVGHVFYREALPSLMNNRMTTRTIDSLLKVAEDRDLIERSIEGALPGSVAYSFSHSAIRRQVYKSMDDLSEKAPGHESFARWLMQRLGDRSRTRSEFIGYHLEKSYLLQKKDASESDGHFVAIGREAAQNLMDSAYRIRRSDKWAAVEVLLRCVELIPKTVPEYIQAHIDLGQVYLWQRDLEAAQGALEISLEYARESGDVRRERLSEILLLRTRAALEPNGRMHEILKESERSLATFLEEGDGIGAALALRARATAQVASGQFDASRASLVRALRRVDHLDRRDARQIRRQLATLLSWGTLPVGDAIARARRQLQYSHNDRGLRRELLGQLAVLNAMAGNREAALSNLDQARRMLDDFRSVRSEAWFEGFVAARAYLSMSDLDQAQETLRASFNALHSRVDRAYKCIVAAELADVCFRLDRTDDSITWLSQSSELSVEDDILAAIIRIGVTAKLDARRGNSREARTHLRHARKLVARTDDLDRMGWVAEVESYLDLRAGRMRRAAAAASRATKYYWQRENSAAARRARLPFGTDDCL